MTFNTRLGVLTLESRVTPSAIPPPPGLISWWTGDGDATDLVGPNNGSLQNGAGFRQGFVGDGFDFDGLDDLFQATTTGLPIGSADRTITLWVRMDQQVSEEGTFAAYGNFAPTQLYHLGRRDDGLPYVTTFFPAIFGSPINTGEWYHVAASNVGTAFKLYVNGSVVASGNMAVNTPGGAQFWMGRFTPEYPTSHFDGTTDEVAVFNRALSDSEILSVYQAGHDGMIKPYMIVNSSSPSEGDTIAVPPLTFEVSFSHPVSPASVQASDFTVNGIAAGSYSLLDADTVRFECSASPVTTPGSQTMSMAAGAVQASDGAAQPSLRAWSKTFQYKFPLIVTNLLDSGPGSLRQAVIDANANAGSDTITFAGTGASGTISLLTALPQLGPDTLTISGPGAGALTIRRDPAANTTFGLISETGILNISGLTLTGGVAPNGGAIWMSGSVNIAGCAINGNTATGFAGEGGGAIFNAGYGQLTITDSVLNNNTAAFSGGAINFNGGATGLFGAALVISNSTMANNSCGMEPHYQYGGGAVMLADHSTLVMNNCTVSGNSASGNGGGLCLGFYFGVGSSIGNSWVIRNSTVSGNSSTRSGGGVAVATVFGTLRIQNSTITSNTALSEGGGIATTGENFGNNFGNAVFLQSAIVAGNNAGLGPDIRILMITSEPNVVTATNSAIGSPSGFTLSPSSSGNLPFGVPLNLGPLQDNGGSTQTRALLPGSPCINAGYNPAGLANDQRGLGYQRVIGSAADIGAFEVQSAAPTVSDTKINDGSIQRSRVTNLTVTFDRVVDFAGAVADAFTLTRNGGRSVSFSATANTINGVTVVALSNFSGGSTQFGSLADGRFTLSALSSQISANGMPLDGDGDGQPGGNYTFGEAQGLFRFFGDINGDRRVDIADYGLFSLSYLNAANYVAAFDFNGDGRIDIADYGQFSLRYLKPLP